jgi:DNA invertase Pin-like site-specific DNA recombinase
MLEACGYHLGPEQLWGAALGTSQPEVTRGRERRASAREARRARGQHIGRPKALDAKKMGVAQRMHASGGPVAIIADTLGVSRAAVYRVLAGNESREDG